MSLIQLATHLLGASLILLHALWHTALWQRKEYRLDRIRAVLTSDERRSIFTPLVTVAALLVVIAWASFWAGLLHLLYAAGISYFALQLAANAVAISRRGVQRPAPTLKAATLVGLITLVLALYFTTVFHFPAPPVLHWITVLFLLPYLTAVAVQVNNIPYALRKRSVIDRARRRRIRLSSLTVIGITGSFGKTSTKFFIQQLLGSTPDIAVTTDRRNAPYVVAQDMLAQLTPQLRYYVVEMGAYKKGEIRALADLAKPTIGVLTAIGNQHLALFGSLENLAAAKWELIESLPVSGTAILNADSETIRTKAKSVRCNIVWVSTRPSGSKKEPVAVAIEPMKIATDHIVATVRLGNKEKRVTLPLVSEALLPNAAAAAAVAHTLGIAPAKIFDCLTKLSAYAHTMQLKAGVRGSLIIDDSYSANEEGVKAALAHLARFAGKKPIVVLRPLEELGPAGSAAHERIGEMLADLNQPVFMVNTNYAEALKRGLARHHATQTILRVAATPHALRDQLLAAIDNDSVVLLEGRIPDVVRQSLLLPT